MTNRSAPNMVLLYGGTFDPVHNGHLNAVWQAQWQLQADAVHLLPCAIPPLKNMPQTSTADRLAMLELVVVQLNRAADKALFTLDQQELAREGKSYTLQTLIECRQRWGDEVVLVWLLGGDSWQTLNQWHQWQALTDYAHLAIVKRPGNWPTLSAEQQQWSQSKFCSIAQLRDRPYGGIVELETTELAIASAQIRRQLAVGLKPLGLVPAEVEEYIQLAGLYLTSN